MNLQQLNELDINDIARWPRVAQGIFIFLCCALLGGGIYYYVIANSMTALAREADKEKELKHEQAHRRAMEILIELANEHYNIDIRKNSGTKQ